MIDLYPLQVDVLYTNIRARDIHTDQSGNAHRSPSMAGGDAFNWVS